ncbi:N-acyl-D-amino-acid deacylase family protein [Candidatus Poriferisocius sp.]|uniref:N-acyl-D-amino-acid deacylase family protein n=1 Tax=Candidatus Poriferisocius sp. TaxID=3101276 RepID=UPI003B0178CA
MSDLIIRGGDLIDGTGHPARPADIRIRSGVVAEVGPGLVPDGETELDAGGCYVSPGFIDSHTHLDPSMFWDRGCDPMPQHGVTTALIGNCSLSLAPAMPEQLHELIDVFCYIEDMPVADFESGIPWTWGSWCQYRDAMNDGGIALNMASLIGHSMLRIYVMGDDAWTREATAEEIEAMATELADAMSAGCYGFSTSFFDLDRRSRPVPSRLACDTELGALADVLAATGQGLVEFIPNLTGDDPHGDIRRMAGILGPRGVTSIWNGLLHTDMAPTRSEEFMALTQDIRDGGCDMWPIASPRTLDLNVSWEQTMVFMMLPKGWNQIMGVSGQTRREMLADPGWRETARTEWDITEKSLFPINRPDFVRFTSVTRPGNECWLGRSLADLTEARGGHPSDVFADWIIENDLEPGVVAMGVSNSNVGGVAKMISDDRCLISASDAGAHVQMMCAAGDTTLLLTRHVRDRGDLELEHAVYGITGRQAEIMGFNDRGRLLPGYAGDVTVFDLNELSWDTDSFVSDLPSGAPRLRRPPGGYRATVVNGVLTQVEGTLTGANPGTVLDSNTPAP